jgi:polysaccharide deacetylase family protein (PEP-CTERM system associated)
LFWLLTGFLAFLLTLLALNALGMLPTLHLPDAWVSRLMATGPLCCLGICFLALGVFVGSRHPKTSEPGLERKHVYIDRERPAQDRKSLTTGPNAEKARHIFTIDLEDYFHTEAVHSTVSADDWSTMPSRVEESMDRLLALLADSDASATVFVLGWVAQKHPELIRRIQSCGHELACHSYMHRPVFRLTAEEFRRDTARAKKVIEDVSGAAVLGYRAPNFSIFDQTPWAFPILADLGFVYDSSTHPIHHDISNNPNAPREPHMVANGQLLELPVSTVRVAGVNWPIGGGGYFRMLPYHYSAIGLKTYSSKHSHPAVFYIHPWELDAYQPRLLMPKKAMLRQYFGLGLTELKLKKLLSTYRFGSVSQVYGDALSDMPATARRPEPCGLNAYA